MSQRVWTVRALALEISRAFERVWPRVVVEGEIAQLQTPASGHCYFTLKDDDAVLGGVMWRTQWRSNHHRPRVGERVRCAGKLGVYQSRVQLYANVIEPAGEGALARQLRERMERLRADGLLDPARKRPLPTFPRTVGVATSADGAAIADFLRVSRQRWPAARILLAPCRVQGAEAPASILRALELLIEHGQCDVLVITRGGGGKEDLLAYMDETLARAIAASPIPTVSAVGHEIDTSLADLVADAVAPTPSAAANVVFPDHLELRRHVDERQVRLLRAWSRAIANRRQRVDALAQRLRHPSDRVRRGRRDLSLLAARGDRAIAERLRAQRQQLAGLHGRLQALSPLAVLERGYAVARTADGAVLRDPVQAAPGALLELTLAGGRLQVRVVDDRAG